MSMPKLKPPAEPPALHPAVLTSAIAVMAAILEYLLLSQLCTAQGPWHPHFYLQVIGIGTTTNHPARHNWWSLRHPTIDGLQQLFSNAGIWHGISSLTAMLKSWLFRVWPTHQSIVVHPLLLLSKHCLPLLMALVLTSIWQYSQFQNSHILPWSCQWGVWLFSWEACIVLPDGATQSEVWQC